MGSDESCKSLAARIEEKVRGRRPYYLGKCCIYRVPPLLRKIYEQDYTPVSVSIGPLHHEDVRFLPMEDHKLTYLQSFLRHSSSNMDLSSYLGIVKELEIDIRLCYADHIHLSSEQFIEMVLIDSVFIIELFRRGYNRTLIEYDDFRRTIFIFETVVRDIKLAENQLPFFVLVRLYRAAAFKPDTNQLDEVPSFTELACKFLRVKPGKVEVSGITKEATSCCHLLDLLRTHYKPSSYLTTDSDKDGVHVSIDIESPVCPTASDLFAAGVRFQVLSPKINDDEFNSSNLLDICFDEEIEILKIPKLQVVDSTKYLFRNLIAFEQCHYLPRNTYFTNYQYFLDRLIDAPEDVQLLVKAGIIENWLGSNKLVSDFINSLGYNTNIATDYYDYMLITQQLVRHRNKRWNRHRATLKQNYFGHPWAAISVIYAIILLLLTVIQVVVGILAIPRVLKGN